MSTEQTIDDKIHGITPAAQLETIEVKQEASEKVPEDKAESQEGIKESEIKQEPEKAVKADSKEPDAIVEETDDYGLEVPKARTYTEEEVQQKIKDRLARAYAAQPAAQQAVVQQATQDFQADPNNPDEWQVQLDQFIDRRLETREKEAKTKQWQEQENQTQAEFQAKFSTSMEKHADFNKVTSKVPITDAMMMSLRHHKDPATFLYAAAKMQPEEVKRIASMQDPFQQAAALGQLDERMKKAKSISRTAAPLKSTGSDVSEKYVPTRSLDDKIQADAKAKRRA